MKLYCKVSNNILMINTIVSNHLCKILKLLLKKYNNKEFENVAYFEPFYLKDFIIGGKPSIMLWDLNKTFVIKIIDNIKNIFFIFLIILQ